MLRQYLVGVNWVDLLIVAAILRMTYIGIKTGVGVEIFKLINLWFVTVVSFHIYTTPLSDYLNTKVPALPLNAGDVFVFVVLVAAITVLFRIIRESFFLLVKIEAHNVLDKWAGLMIGCLRGFWISSIGLYIMTISTVQYLEISAKSSLLGSKLLPMSAQIYKGSIEGFVGKIVPAYGSPNEEVAKAIER